MQFQSPLALLALLLIPLLGALYLVAQRRRRAYAVRFTNLALLREVVGTHSATRRHIPPGFFLIGLSALCLGLAQPTTMLAGWHHMNTVVLVIDTSGSMETPDLVPSRMEAAKSAARTLILGLPADAEVGLVSFSDTARVSAPLSTDHLGTLSALSGLEANGGTAIGDGLNLALELIAQRARSLKVRQLPASIILLTDGQNNEGADPRSATVRAQHDQITVYTVGIGRDNSDLDQSSLKTIASTTHGAYYYAAGGDDLTRIYANLASHTEWSVQRTDISQSVTIVGTVLLLAAGILSLFWLRHFP